MHAISAVQFEWSLLWRAPESDVVPVARRLGIGLVPYSPLGQGLLTATLVPQDIDASVFRRNDHRFHSFRTIWTFFSGEECFRVAVPIVIEPSGFFPRI